jgi:hypothetical protein
MWNVLGVVLLFLYVVPGNTQNTNASKLKVFIDCRTGCDMQFIRTEMTPVDFVTNRLAADAHVLITTQSVGSGGTQYQLIFYGQNKYSNFHDTSRFVTTPVATASEKRQRLTQSLLLGLLPMIAKTPFISNVTIAINNEAPLPTVQPTDYSTRDKWNFWAFRIGVQGELSADKVYNTHLLNANFSANRTTDKLKMEFYLTGSTRHSVTISEEAGRINKIIVDNSDYGIFHNIVRSFDAHWSYGYQTNFSNSTFNNIKRKFFFNPAIEYNIFDYKEVNNRSFVIRYGVDVNHNQYYDTTIYNKIKETLYGHRFSTALTLNKKWGTFFTGFNYRNYFRSWKLNSMGISVRADVRVTGGLSFFFNANGSLVHNQISLVKGEVSEQDILTRKRQLASSYNYYTGFGLNFRFGSILNNFVNPRFEGYGGF